QIAAATGEEHFSVSQNGTLAYMPKLDIVRSQLIWVDRAGRSVGMVGEAGPYQDLSLSPDESRLAYTLFDARSGSNDVWWYDLRRQVASRFTFGASSKVWPIWSPAGDRIAFASDKGGPFGMFIKPMNAGGEEALPLSLSSLTGEGPGDWS